MAIMDYFKPVRALSPEKVREYLDKKNPSEYTLVDVRQRHEYERGHLPGAILIPGGELPERVRELDPKKPTIVY